jgi:Fe-Mn family superoxide dismutase
MKKGGGGEPNGELAIMIKKYFGNFEEFKKQFSMVANGVFGSGWAWLCLNKNGDLELRESDDQDAPLTQGSQAILGLDVWEHAYFLQYENRRAEYVESWWNIVNWDAVEEKYRMIIE